jgi:hypothetical protein
MGSFGNLDLLGNLQRKIVSIATILVLNATKSYIVILDQPQ